MLEILMRISVFLVLGKTLLHFCPSKKYERYLKLLFGFMVMIQVVTPIFSFVGMNFEETYEAKMKEFEQKLEQSVSDADEEWFAYHGQIEAYIEKECAETELLVQEQLQETTEGQLEQQAETGQTDVERIRVETITVEVRGNE